MAIVSIAKVPPLVPINIKSRFHGCGVCCCCGHGKAARLAVSLVDALRRAYFKLACRDEMYPQSLSNLPVSMRSTRCRPRGSLRPRRPRPI
jgi:hypothetical protein